MSDWDDHRYNSAPVCAKCGGPCLSTVDKPRRLKRRNDRAVRAGAAALAAQIPCLCDDFTESGLRLLAQVVLDAVALDAAQKSVRRPPGGR